MLGLVDLDKDRHWKVKQTTTTWRGSHFPLYEKETVPSKRQAILRHRIVYMSS